MPNVREALAYEPVELQFGTSGLRGLVKDMTDLECYLNTRGFLACAAQTGALQSGSDIYVATDLRHSSARIARAVNKAITDSGFTTVNCGFIPTPTLACYAMAQNAPSIMITGSHLPDDRNGLKFYKSGGEVLKEDELLIHQAVSQVRATVYAQPAGLFTPEGMLTQPAELPKENAEPVQHFIRRYANVFAGTALTGKTVVCYEHSSVGREMLAELLTGMGATVVPVGRSQAFVPLDSENVTPDDRAYFKVLAKQHAGAFAIVSLDGDADRPFVIDEQGVFHRGDVLGALVASWIQTDAAAYPISASDAVDRHLTSRGIQWQHTRIGSPYVVAAMDEARRAGAQKVVGWEVNGGFMTASDTVVNGKELPALPTRDAFLPILATLAMAAEAQKPVSQLFAALPQRYTQAGLLDNFPPQIYRAFLDTYLPDSPEVRKHLGTYFDAAHGFSAISQVNGLDGVRIYFDNGEVAHIRLSQNAPQLRMYSVADTQERADQMVELAIANPDGIFRHIQKDLAKVN